MKSLPGLAVGSSRRWILIFS